MGKAKFDDFASLEYGKGYEIYCKATQAVTVTLKGKLPTTSVSKSLSVGWQLLPALTVDASKPLSWLLAGVDYEQVQRYDTLTSSLTPATDAQPGAAYFVKVRTASTWTPPLPRDVTTSFVYDGDGGKVKQITASGTTKFLGESYEVAPDGKTTKYVFAGSQRIAAKDSTGALRFYHGDHLGSTNLVTDGTGAVLETTEYTPYGSVAVHTGTSDVTHKFTGQRQDAGTGLVLFPGRAYDPQLGRFLQADPFVQDPADPQMLNRYSYVRNNPLNFTDPSGYKKKRGFFRFLFAAVAAVVVTVITGGHAELGAAIFSAIAVAGAAVVGDQVGAAVDRRASSSSSSSAEASSPRGPPSTPSPESRSPGFGAPMAAEAGLLPVAGSVAISAGAETAAAGLLVEAGTAILAAIVINEGARALRQTLDDLFSGQHTRVGEATRAQARSGWRRYLHGTDEASAKAIRASPRGLIPGSYVTTPEAVDPMTGKTALQLNPTEFRRFVSQPRPGVGDWFVEVLAPKQSVVPLPPTEGGAPQWQIYGEHIVVDVYPNPNK